MRLKTRSFFIFICILFFFSIFSCKKEKETEKKQYGKVEAISVKKDKLKNTWKNIGNLNYKSKHSISSLVNGRLEKIYAKEGEYIYKGKILAQLKNVQLENQKKMYENNLSEAKVSLKIAEDNLYTEKLSIEKNIKSFEKQKLQLNQARIEYEHKKQCYKNNLELQKVGGISDLKIKEEELNLSKLKTSLDIMEKDFEINSIGFRDIDIESHGFKIPSNSKEKEELLISINSKQAYNLIQNEKTKVDTAQKNLMNIENLMEELKIKSAVSGIIGSCNHELGDFISENEPCFVIIDTSILFATFYVQEQDIYKYKIGLPLEITIPSVNETLNTVISEISPVADPVSGNFCVKSLIENEDSYLKPGMFINCSFTDSENKEYYIIPETSLIHYKEDECGVYSIYEDHVFYKNVKVHCKKNGIAYIEDGINENEIIVDKPSVFLREGDKVEVK